MFNNPVLDVVIGLVFIFLLYSLLATILQELVATNLSFRSKMLERAILRMLEDGKSTSGTMLGDRINGITNLLLKRNLLMDKKVAAWFYAHPLIKYLGEDNYHSKPAYITAQSFSKVIIDLLKGMNTAGTDVPRLNDSISKGIIHHLPIDLESDQNNPAIAAIRSQLPSSIHDGIVQKIATINPDTRLFLQTIWNEAGGDVTVFKQKLEQWFDDTMERASGWYKRYTRIVLFMIGFVVAVGFNVDTISITKKLSHDPKLREQMVQSANSFLERNKQLGTQLNAAENEQNNDYETLTALRAAFRDATDSNTKLQLTKDIEELEKQKAKKSIQLDSLRKDYAYISDRTTKLIDSSKTLIDGDIAKVNNLMALGWKKGFPTIGDDQDWTCIFGWILTALAISLGAPFWFDMLNKLMKLRGTGTKVESGAQPATAQGQVTNPVSVNINTQTGEEAVG